MNCRQVQKKLALHAGDDLDARESASISAHLKSCLACFRDFSELRELLGTVRSTGGARVRGDAESESLVAGVMRQIHGPPPPAPQLLPRLAMVSGWAAALLLAVTLGWRTFAPTLTPAGDRARPGIIDRGTDPRLMTIENGRTVDVEDELGRQVDELRRTGSSRGARAGADSPNGPASPAPIVVPPRKRNL